MYKSHYVRVDEAMKLEYKKIANSLTNMKTRPKKQYFADELENSRETLEKRGSYFAHCFQESHVVLQPYHLISILMVAA